MLFNIISSLKPKFLVIIVIQIGLTCSLLANGARECSGPGKCDLLSSTSFQIGPVQGDKSVVSADLEVVDGTALFEEFQLGQFHR